MPAKQPLRRQRLVVALCGVEHHLDDAFNMTVSSLKPTDVETKPTSDGRADLIGIELLAFDLTALDHVLGEGAKNSLLFQPETERFHLADQSALQVPGGGQRRRQAPRVPSELGPIRKLMDIIGHSPRFLR